MENKPKLKFTASILALIMAAGSFALAASSCQSGTSNPTDATTAAAGATTALTQSTTLTQAVPDVPDTDWGGKTITFFVRGPAYTDWQSQDIYAEGETGAPVNDAVYKRNQTLQQKYNFVIAQVASTDTNMQTTVEKSIKAGSNDYQVLMLDGPSSYSMATKGEILDLNQIPNLNLKNPAWDQNSIASYTMQGKTPFMTGALSIMAYDATQVFYFNKQMIKDYSLDDPYTLVQNGQWTMDKMIEMMKPVAKDLNGDGKWDETDQYGLATLVNVFGTLFYNAGLRISTMDSTGTPVITINDPKLPTVISDTLTITNPPLGYNAYVIPYTGVNKGSEYLNAQQIFEGGRALFMQEVLQLAQRMRATTTDFGILPGPKFDTNQSSYYNMVITANAVMISLPMTLSDDDRAFAGFVLEALAVQSENGLTQAYYNTALEGQYLRDTESQAMLDIIFQSRSYDLGYVADWGTIWSSYVSMLQKGQSDFASVYAKHSAAADVALQKSIVAWQGMQ